MTLEQYFSQNHINQDVYQRMTKLVTLVKYHTGDTIVNMGERYPTINLILEGIVRGYYIDQNGNDITKCFSKEGGWCGYYNFLQKGPSPFYIEALEDCSLAQIHVDDLRQAVQKDTDLNHLYESLTKEAFLEAEERGSSFQRLDARERYISFQMNHPDICRRVKQELIASYLGITPSSLSRIKKTL